MDFAIRRAEYKDADEIYRIMMEAYEALENKDFYVVCDLDFVNDHIERNGFAVVAEHNGNMAGFFIIRFPYLEDDNLGRDINLPEDELEKVVLIESVAVLPKYRGNGLQSKLIAEAEKLIPKEFKYYLGTADPANIPSCKSFEKMGYSGIKELRKYGGYMRRIYRKDVK